VHEITSLVRRWLPALAVLLALAAMVPPAGTYARRYAVAQAAQFVLFAVVVPALLAAGWPARMPVPRWRRPPTPAARAIQPGPRAAASLLPFVLLAVGWRLPAALSALDRDPALAAAELVTLASAGTVVWLELAAGVASPRLPRPLRAAVAAVAMWTIWVVAYVTGMAGVGAPVRASALSAADDRQLAAAVLWAVPAICFVPVVYTNLMRWLGDRSEAEPAVPHGRSHEAAVTAPRPPRGWRR